MADNFSFSQGSGAQGAAKNISGVLYPQVIATEIDGSDTGLSAKLGSLTETAPSTDTASSGLNGRLQRIAQRLTSLIALLPTSLGAGGGLKVDGSGTALPVSGTFFQSTQPVSEADGAHTTFGSKADAKSTATDTTAITAMQVWKQISASVQAIATSIAGTITVATHAVTQSGTWLVSTNADGTTGSAVPSKGLLVQGSDGTDARNIATTNAGVVKVDISATASNSTAIKVDGSSVTQPVSIATAPVLVAGSAIIGKVGIDQTTVGTTNGVTPVPAASGGPTVARIKAAASTNATSVKGSAGQIYGYALFNNTAAAKFFKVYNKASSPTVGTDTPAFTIIVPASGGANVEFSMGVPLGTGIAYAITGAVADSDTTSVSADDVHGVLLYK